MPHDTAPDVTITSFGYLHNPPPPAHITLDLRVHFRDPHIDPGLRYMTAHDQPVRRAVLRTAGVKELVAATATAVLAFRAGPSAGPVTVACGCQGGRHRAATLAMALAGRLRMEGLAVTIHHRDLHQPVVHR